MKKILFSDLDGTLLKSIWIKFKDRLAIHQEMKKGLIFVISTGRELKSFNQFLFINRMNFDYAVLGNGSQIIDRQKRIINEVTFDTNELLEALYLIASILEQKTKIVVTVTLGNKTKIIKNFKIHDDSKIKQEFSDKISHCCISLIGEKLTQELKDYLITNIDFLNIEINGKYIDITKVNINKAYGVSKITEYLDEKSVRTYAIGDSDNDISMIKAVDFGFAIKTGTKGVKNVANMEVSNIYECIKMMKLQE